MRREPHRKMRRIRISVCRRSASPSFLREDKSKWRVRISEADFPNSHLALDKTPTRIALRERWLFPPPRSGGGGPLELAQRANRGGGGTGL
jgi:hypothetical protein